MSTFIIAEAGVNHNGSVSLAKKMVDVAKAAGADCIKFQTFNPESLVTENASMAEYQQENTGKQESQIDMLKKLALSYDDFCDIKKYCDSVGIMFLSTPFDLDSIDFLDGLGQELWKIPSGEITNYPYLRAIGRTKKPVVLSTGMSTISEIEQAVDVLKEFGTEKITLLHCTTEYPAPFDEINLKAMEHLKKHFNFPVGYSDHTKGILAPVLAVGLGAVIIEKHFTLDKNLEGPDHKASLEPDELGEMVKQIRLVEQIMKGSGVKEPTESEKKNIPVARKSIVAACDIKAGDCFTEKNLTTKRPGMGISPMEWNSLIGRCAKKDYRYNELIEENEMR
ncbi:MAG: N-acetylneuraminate synthase [Clostridium sp.]|nr:N-acetylneuraminate synthase [Clostridium sp.]MCM1207432.1 N-acetylneuraminate synthase [Ruminococcus sp.]